VKSAMESESADTSRLRPALAPANAKEQIRTAKARNRKREGLFTDSIS
jgi:hypothetical protein